MVAAAAAPSCDRAALLVVQSIAPALRAVYCTAAAEAAAAAAPTADELLLQASCPPAYLAHAHLAHAHAHVLQWLQIGIGRQMVPGTAGMLHTLTAAWRASDGIGRYDVRTYVGT